jgi:hypothetical protein
MCAIHTAKELLEMMRLGCYKIELKGDLLEVSPAFSIDDEMADLIRLHKAELIKLLESEIPA